MALLTKKDETILYSENDLKESRLIKERLSLIRVNLPEKGLSLAIILLCIHETFDEMDVFEEMKRCYLIIG